MPGRKLLGRIVDEYHLDPKESLRIFTEGSPDEFGRYLREQVFEPEEAEGAAQETGAKQG